MMRVTAKAGYNASTAQNQYTELYFKTSNGVSSQAGTGGGTFYGDAASFRNTALGGSSSSPSVFRIVQNSSTSYTIYGAFSQFTGSSVYSIEIPSGSSWVDSSSLYGATAPTGTYLEITPSTLVGPQGTQGTQGTQGQTGTTGTNGTQGAQGTQGQQGITGNTGTQGTAGTQGTQGTLGTAGPSTSINSTANTTTTVLYPVMVSATGSNQTPYSTTTSGYFQFNASNGGLQVSTFGVGTAPSGTAGEIRATNNITAYYSDERLKTRIGSINDPIQKVQSLSGFYFVPNDAAVALGYDKKIDVGVSAQEVEAILPEIIAPAPIDSQYKTVRYEKLVPLLIEAIKSLAARVDELEKR